MAQRVVLIDDLDGSEGAETIRYTVDGQEYEIDLSKANARKFRTVLQPYLDKSRPVEPEPALQVVSTRVAVEAGAARAEEAPAPGAVTWRISGHGQRRSRG